LSREKANLVKNNIKINFIGRLDNLPNSLTEKMKELHEATKRNNKLILNIAINYSGRTEIVDALKSILLKIDNKKLGIEEINENTVKDNLYTHNIPDPDLLIRTAGEIPVFWPDFDENNLVEAIRNFQKRVRKYGGKV
jgi:undecaprenyl diphosphate synthase